MSVARTSVKFIVREDGTRIAYTVGGSGPLVVLVHGFPESWYSWRHQISALIAAGYKVAAVHVRGYGQSDKPKEIEAYTSRENAEDIRAIILAEDPSGAYIAGHDWGSVLVQNTVFLFPEIIKGVITVSVPIFDAPTMKMSDAVKGVHTDKFFYQTYFQEPGVAEKEINEDPDLFLQLFYYYMSGDNTTGENILIRPADNTALLEGLEVPDELPAWIRDDFHVYSEELRSGGFTGPLNRYRAADLDFEDLKETYTARITQPILFIGGAEDPSRYIYGVDSYETPLIRSDDPRGEYIIEGAGHWLQQEAPDEVNAYMIDFLDSLAKA